jgi:hypothetical protein
MENSPAHNSDGLIKCLPPSRDNFPVNPKIYALKFCSIYKILWDPDCSISRDKVYVGCGPTRWCLVFCSSPRLFHRDTKLHSHLSGLGTVSQFHRDPKLTPVYQPSKNTPPRCWRQQHIPLDRQTV